MRASFLSLRASDCVSTIPEWCLFKGGIYSKKYGTANTEMVKALVEASQYVEWLLYNIKLKCTEKYDSDDISTLIVLCMMRSHSESHF